MSSVAGRDPSLLLSGGAHGAVEGMLERLGGKNRSVILPFSNLEANLPTAR